MSGFSPRSGTLQSRAKLGELNRMRKDAFGFLAHEQGNSPARLNRGEGGIHGAL